MRRLFSASLLLSLLTACRQSPSEQPEPEYADWYALKAPEARGVEAVAGDLDGTLAVATRFKIYTTTDRGKTWQTSNYPGTFGVFGLVVHRDTLLALTAGQGGIADSTTAYASGATHYSTDQGRTWQRYQYSASTAYLYDIKAPRNRVRTPAGNIYRVAVKLLPKTSSSSSYITTPGIQRDGGPLQELPHTHQINNLYLDQRARLYVAASAPLCGQGQDFAYCGEANGILYVSKQPLP